MRLQGAMRERQAPERWCWAEERHGASPEAWESPTGKAAPDSPCLRCQPVEPAILDERGEEGPLHTGDGGKGGRGQPVLPSVQRLGSRKARTGPGEQHATSLVPPASSIRNPG